MKTLVLYYSRSGNTRAIAEAVAAALQADLEELKGTGDYSGVLGFARAGRDVLAKRHGTLPPLQHKPAEYDLIVVGQPVWAARPVPAVSALLSTANLAGKKVALFVTFDGGGDAGCLAKTTAMLASSQVVSQSSYCKVGANRAARIQQAQQWAKTLQ